MADRTQRIQSIIGKNIREIIQFEVKNPKIGFVSISEVKVSTDFSYAKVYVTFLGSNHPENNLEELRKTKGFIRSSLAKKLDIRKTPDITFELDRTYEKTQRIEELLEKEERDLEKLKK